MLFHLPHRYFTATGVFVFLISLTPLFAMSCLSPRLANQRVLVTGAGRGIGRAIALICQQEGAKVAITSRTQSELEETAAANSKMEDLSPMSIHVTDVTNVSQVEDTVKSIVKEWGGIDILINNAGGSQRTKGPLETLVSVFVGSREYYVGTMLLAFFSVSVGDIRYHHIIDRSYLSIALR